MYQQHPASLGPAASLGLLGAPLYAIGNALLPCSLDGVCFGTPGALSDSMTARTLGARRRIRAEDVAKRGETM